ncbi:MAG TPA: hypothetical protein VK425_03495 [Acidimicrobiales bacterium]|nr:hypothetical protein [Acidimicrobiales bacterium]
MGHPPMADIRRRVALCVHRAQRGEGMSCGVDLAHKLWRLRVNPR